MSSRQAQGRRPGTAQRPVACPTPSPPPCSRLVMGCPQALYGTFGLRVALLPVPTAPVLGILAYCAACAGLLAWQRSRWAQSGRSYARWREALAALMRLAGTGFGAWPALTGEMLATWAPMRHPTACVLLLVFASGGPSCLHHALSWKMRFWCGVGVGRAGGWGGWANEQVGRAAERADGQTSRLAAWLAGQAPVGR